MKQKEFSRKVMFFVAVVVFVIAIFSAVSVNAVAPGGVYCKDLAGCAGSPGCPEYGSVSGCIIDCSGGGSVWCDWASPDPS